MDTNISFTLKVWRQNGPTAEGHFDTFEMKDIPGDTSFLEMLDILNEQLIEANKEPFVFDHDCREGICGMCSLYINGHPHGPAQGATTCQLYMRRFHDGDVITVEPWRSAAFPVIKTAWSIVLPLTKSLLPAVILPYAPVRLRMLTLSSFLSRMPTRLWTALLASVVVLA